MNFGMRCHDICPKGDVDTVLDAVRAAGVSQIQLALGKSISGYDFGPGHYSPGLAHMLADKIRERGIHVAVLGCYINPTDPDEGKRQASVAKFIEHLKYAKIIGADMVGTETGRYSTSFQVVPETYTENCYQLLLKSMREIVKAAEKLGVIVGVEGVHDHTLYNPEMMRRFLDDIDSPVVEVILDPVNLISKENYKEQEAVVSSAFDLYQDRITMMHIKDFRMEESGPQVEFVGEGLFRYEPLIARLKKEKPHIALLLENSTPQRYHDNVLYLQKIYQQV